MKTENSSYLERSVFIGVFFNTELIGFIKHVINPDAAIMMQILSKMAYFDKQPTNAMISKAVEIYASRGIKYLVYGEYSYGQKGAKNLIELKQNNGFEKVDMPRYYCPLTLRRRILLALGLHKGVKALISPSLWRAATALREKWYERRRREPSPQ